MNTQEKCRVCGSDNMDWNKCPNVKIECNDCCGCDELEEATSEHNNGV